MDLLPVYIVSFLVSDSTADLKRSNATEDLTAGSCFGPDFHSTFLQFGHHTVDLRQHLLFLLFSDFQSFVQLLAVGRTGFYGQSAGDQKVTGITVFYLNHFVLAAKI